MCFLYLILLASQLYNCFEDVVKQMHSRDRARMEACNKELSKQTHDAEKLVSQAIGRIADGIKRQDRKYDTVQMKNQCKSKFHIFFIS
jgi:hypothetical protein